MSAKRELGTKRGKDEGKAALHDNHSIVSEPGHLDTSAEGCGGWIMKKRAVAKKQAGDEHRKRNELAQHLDAGSTKHTSAHLPDLPYHRECKLKIRQNSDIIFSYLTLVNVKLSQVACKV